MSVVKNTDPVPVVAVRQDAVWQKRHLQPLPLYKRNQAIRKQFTHPGYHVLDLTCLVHRARGHVGRSRYDYYVRKGIFKIGGCASSRIRLFRNRCNMTRQRVVTKSCVGI